MDTKDYQNFKQLICLKHQKAIEQIYLKDDEHSKLVCFRCQKENKLDYDFLVDIEYILLQKDETIFNNLPPQMSEYLYSQLMEQHIQQGNKEQMIEQFSNEFDAFTQAIVDSLSYHKKMVINHIGLIDDQRLDIIKQYNEISSKKDIRDHIIQSSDNQELLKSYLNDLVKSKKTSLNQDEKNIKSSLKIHNQLSNKLDNEYIKNNMLDLLEQIKQLNLIKSDFIQSQPKQIITSSSPPPTAIIEQTQQPQFVEEQQPSLNSIPTVVDSALQNNNITEDISLPSFPLIEKELIINSLNELESNSQIIYHQNIRFCLRDKCLSGQNMKQLSDGINGCNQLKELYLDLQKNSINDSDIEYLCKKLQSSTKLTKLVMYLQLNNIEQTGITHITQLLSSLSYIRHLELGLNCNNNITDEDVQPLIKIISTKNQLNYLFLGLSQIKIGTTTLRQISDGLKSLTNLNTIQLALSHNNIADNDDVTYLGQGIQSLKSSLTEIRLWLQDNQIQNKGAQDLFNAISSCSQLQQIEINLDHNKIGTQYKKQLNRYKQTLKTTCQDLNDVKIKL